MKFTLPSSIILGLCSHLIATGAGAQELREAPGVALRKIGFCTSNEPDTRADFITLYDAAKMAVPQGTVIRTGIVWDPTLRDAPNFDAWNTNVLEPAFARGIVVIPSVKTMNMALGGYRYPTDAQWTTGLRKMVRMYGPGGTFAQAHPGFPGITGFELWNEPNSQGNMNGYMTPARITHLLKIGSAAIHAEAKLMNDFDPNVMGPAIGGIDLNYVKSLKSADPNVFSYLDTITFHDYMKNDPNTCTAGGIRCVKTYDLIRSYLDSNGGGHLHMGTTEGGYAGSNDSCRPVNVLTESLQADYTEDVIRYLRARPSLKFDFHVTFTIIDENVNSSVCGSGYDTDYWINKLGVVRADGSLKAVGQRLNFLVNQVMY